MGFRNRCVAHELFDLRVVILPLVEQLQEENRKHPECQSCAKCHSTHPHTAWISGPRKRDGRTKRCKERAYMHRLHVGGHLNVRIAPFVTSMGIACASIETELSSNIIHDIRTHGMELPRVSNDECVFANSVDQSWQTF